MRISIGRSGLKRDVENVSSPTKRRWPIFGQELCKVMHFGAIIAAAVLFALVGAAVGGKSGFFVGALLGVAVGAMVTRRKAARPPDIPRDYSAASPQISVSLHTLPSRPVCVPKARKGPLRWIPPCETVSLAGYKISSGMIYVCDGEPEPEEASAVNTRLPVGTPTHDATANLGYYSQYRFISPEQRGAYLEWLAAGRKDTNPEIRDLGYVFLFFYGIERRLLVDKAQDQEVVAELVRVLNRYGRSHSLRSYICQLIHFWGWRQGPDYYARLRDWMDTLPVSLLGQDEMAIVFASLHQAGKPLPAKLAFDFAMRHPEARRSVVVKRVNEELRALFEKRYLERLPEGLLLRSAKNPVCIQYRPASPSLLGFHCGNRETFSITTPNVMGISSQFKPLVAIWDSCIEDLVDYSRAKGKREGAISELKAHLALPEDLRSASTHPLACQWNDLLSTVRHANACWFIATNEAAQLLEIPKRATLTISQSRDLARAIESLGFAVEPDSRYCGNSYGWDQEIGVFKPKAGKVAPPSSQCLGARMLLELCMLIAGSDGSVSLDELNVSRRFIEKDLALTPEDLERMSVFEQLLVDDPLQAKASLSRIARRVPREQRERIGEVLVYVAGADNLITKDEIKALERVFRSFELPPEKLEELLQTIKPEFRETTIQPAGKRVPGETIPTPGFRIDMSRVEAIAQETNEVIGILARVMTVDEEDETPLGPQAISLTGTLDEPISRAATVEKIPGWLSELDSKYHLILLKLIERESWPRVEFEELSMSCRLMPLDVHDAINEWSDEQLGDFLLDGEDPVIVHKNLLPEGATEHV